MITGYFLSERTSPYPVSKIFLQVLFYSLAGALLLACKTIFLDKSFDKKLFITYLFFPITGGIWWFPLSYSIIVFVCPVINSFTKLLNRRGFILLLAFVFVWWKFGANFINAPFERLQSALCCYLCGVFYKRYCNEFKIKRSILFWVSVLLFFCLGIAYFFYFTLRFSSAHNSTFLYFLIICILNPLVAFCIFSYALQIKACSKLINFISGTTFGVYLCHENWYGHWLFGTFMFNLYMFHHL